MTTLVTGATGHVGANLVRALLEAGREVRALVRTDTRALEGLDVQKVSGDILDVEELKTAFDGVRTVFHLAGHISVCGDPGGLMKKTNVIGTRNVVATCLECGVSRLVHFSSIHALSAHPVDAVVDETRPLAVGRGLIPYDATKAGGEKEVQKGVALGLDAVVVNPTSVLGPFDYKLSPMGEVIYDLMRGRLPALVKAGFDWVDVRDVVRGAISAEERGRTGERYLLSGNWASVVELADLVAESSGTPRPRFVSPMPLARIGAPFSELISRISSKRPRYTRESLRTLRNHQQVSHDKATRELGHSPRPLRETIADTVEWFRNNT